MRVKNIFVSGLFGRFDYSIPMNLDQRITIIHGPNGFGKTVLLRMLADVFNNTDASLLSVPYSEFKVSFDNDEEISVKVVDGKEPSKPNLHFVYRGSSGVQEFDASPRFDKDSIPLHSIDQIIAELNREDVNSWRPLMTGESLTLDDA